jgi:diguanylate cyclase (GGDEF)-like protein
MRKYKTYITPFILSILTVFFIWSFYQSNISYMLIGSAISFIGLVSSILFRRSSSLEINILRDQAMHDGLTGLLNQKIFKERLSEEISRSARYKSTNAVLFMDIDKFKRINDTHGHLFGDYVIKETARIINENLRNIDVVSRYAGEEFAAILVNTNRSDATRTAKRIRKKIEDYVYSDDKFSDRITISIGISVYPIDGENERELLFSADQSMYLAKKAGGNLVKP